MEFPTIRYFYRYRRDLWLASVVLIIGIVLSAYGWIGISKSSVSHTLMGTHFPVGVSSVAFLQDDRCIGNITFELTEDSVTVLRINGEVRVIQNGKKREVPLKALGFFNPLGQMFQSRVEVEVGEIRVEGRTEYINPIEAFGSFRSPAGTVKRKISFPGPLLLKIHAGKYTLVSESQGSSLYHPARGLLTKQLGLSVTGPQPIEEICPEDKRGYLSVGPITSQLQQLIHPFSQGLQGRT